MIEDEVGVQRNVKVSMKWVRKLVYGKVGAEIIRLKLAEKAFLNERRIAAREISMEQRARIRAEKKLGDARLREEALQDVIQQIVNSYQPADIKDELRGKLSICNEDHFRVNVGVSELEVVGPHEVVTNGCMRSDIVKMEGRVGFCTAELEMSHHLTVELATLLGVWVKEELLRRQGWGV